MLEIVFYFSLLSYLLFNSQMNQNQGSAYISVQNTWYGGHFEFQDGGKLN